MRATVDLPDELHRSLKARAALSGVSLKELIQRLIEQGLRQPGASARWSRREPPPVIIAPCGAVILTVPLKGVDEDDDVARSARR
ncbi:hypothetical protein DYH09_21640 [bacterium CPR1]|nr:hypothetical protein [bacterium CPR1]